MKNKMCDITNFSISTFSLNIFKKMYILNKKFATSPKTSIVKNISNMLFIHKLYTFDLLTS